MVARFAGTSLGLFAFSVTVIAGLFAQNSVTHILTRAIVALFVFCLLGLILGAAAESVLEEHSVQRREGIARRFQEMGHEQGGPAAKAGQKEQGVKTVDDSGAANGGEG